MFKYSIKKIGNSFALLFTSYTVSETDMISQRHTFQKNVCFGGIFFTAHLTCITKENFGISKPRVTGLVLED